MVKGKKTTSSASSGTRKKHARKAAGAVEQLPLPKEKKQKDKAKGKNKEPRKKEFIQPYKPAPIQPDPLNALGLANRLTPELVVVLRMLGKKDAVTKRKAIEVLQSDWVERVLKAEDGGGVAEANLGMALPVWLHHLPSLFLHSSRTIRALTAGLHASLLQIPAMLEQTLYYLRETGSSGQVEAVVGSWCLATHDIDRLVCLQARKSWDAAVRTGPATPSTASEQIALDEMALDLLIGFVERAVLDPSGIYAQLNPVQPSFAPAAPQAPRKGAARQPPVSQPKRIDEETHHTRVRVEEEEENEEDRGGRIRVGAFGALKWILDKSDIVQMPARLSELLSKPSLWTSLYHGSNPPFHTDSGYHLGHNQVVVRKATWAVLCSLVKDRKDEVERILPLLSSAILRSAWVELDATVISCMWEPLLTFLTQYRKAWDLDMSKPAAAAATHGDDSDSDDDESSDESEEGEEDVHDGHAKEIAQESKVPARSEAYQEFLQFLQLGCSGSPLQGYPAVVVILSTIPNSILDFSGQSWREFFTSFWAALDGRALSSLERAATSAAFLTSLLECLVFLIKRNKAESGDSDGAAKDGVAVEVVKAVVAEQFTRTWTELASRRLRADGDAVGKIVARTLLSLAAVDEDLLNAAWAPIVESSRELFKSPHSDSSELLVAVLKVFSDQFKGNSMQQRHLRGLINESSEFAVNHCETLLQDPEGTPIPSSLPLTNLIDKFGEILFEDADITARLDNLLSGSVSAILAMTPSILVVYLRQRSDHRLCSSLWQKALRSVANDPAVGEKGLPALLDLIQDKPLPGYLKPEDDELDSFAGRLMSEVLSGNGGSKLSTVRQLLQHPGNFLSRHSAAGLLHSIIYAFSEKTRQLLRDPTVLESASVLYAPLHLISSVMQTRPDVAHLRDLRMFLPDMFIFGHLFPRFAVAEDSLDSAYVLARQIWEACTAQLVGDDRVTLFSALKGVLRDLIADVDCTPTPVLVLQVVSEGLLESSIDVLNDLFPSEEQLDEMLQDLPSNPIDITLAVIEPLVPPLSTWRTEAKQTPSYDSSGFSEYSRIVNALLYVMAEDRHLARANIWALRHFLVLAHSANEMLQVPSSHSALFRTGNSKTIMDDIIARVQKIATFLLAIPVEDTWHASVVNSILHGIPPSSLDLVGQFVTSIATKARSNDIVRESLVLHAVLQHVLGGATKEDADHWILLARKFEKQAPQASIAVTMAVTEFAPEPPRLERYRNELAAGILGIPAAKANSDGLLLLRRLAATAPDPDSDAVFLPQPRAVNFMKVCQQWITSDEDLDEDVDSEMTLIFCHLAPILQNVPGSHWDLIFDMIETTLENCSFADTSTLVMLGRTLKLITSIRELASSNKALRALWGEREISVLTLTRDLVAKPSASDSSVPLSVCWELAFSIVQDLPSSLIDHDTLATMCHLLLDSSVVVQRMAYALLQKAASKRTEYLVVEAGVDTSGESKFELPPELLHILQTALEQGEEIRSEPNPLGYLLGWMITFDLFNEASLKVKMGYAGQLRDLDLIGSNFLPSVLDLLGLYEGRGRTSLDGWAIDEYYVQLYDPESPLSLKLLAAHLFYRALLNVPSLVRGWWSECKDVQLSTAVESLTTRNFSPVLIAAELALVKDPDAVMELTGENLTVKVASATNEVTATFLVDEQQMEIGIKLPANYPLHGIEVRDIRRVAVDEKRWRAWLFAVQQMVTSQNGRIVDGLSIYKKNVTHHFEGQTECAICYSIISVTELSLPKIKCKTCNNRFHSECLYKWFKTSHTSTCPLCRSDFI